jgi:hypothetical protein
VRQARVQAFETGVAIEIEVGAGTGARWSLGDFWRVELILSRLLGIAPARPTINKAEGPADGILSAHRKRLDMHLYTMMHHVEPRMRRLCKQPIVPFILVLVDDVRDQSIRSADLSG